LIADFGMQISDFKRRKSSDLIVLKIDGIEKNLNLFMELY
jgi:hypothetical protein